MTDTKMPMAFLKVEGAPIHPDELTYECSCDKCLEARKRQLKAYNDFHGIKEGSS